MAVEHGPSCCWVGSDPGLPATQAKPFVLCSCRGKIHILFWLLHHHQHGN